MAKNVRPDKTGMAYSASAAARSVNHSVPPSWKDGSVAMRLTARKKQTNNGPCASSGTNDLIGLQSYLRRVQLSCALPLGSSGTSHALGPHCRHLMLVRFHSVRV